MIIFKVVTESFKMQFQVCLVYLTVRLHDMSQFEENAWSLKPITFVESVIFLIIID